MFLQGARPPDVVAIIGIAAVDDDVVRLKPRRELHDGVVRRIARREHHPDRPRPSQDIRDLRERLGRFCAVLRELGYGRGIPVINDALVAIPHQPARDVGAHPSKPDNPDFHPAALLLNPALGVRRPSRCAIPLRRLRPVARE